MSLTPKRRAFVLAYTGEARGNASEAARVAGYASPGVEGCRLLKDAKVCEEIAKKHVPKQNALEMGAAELRETIARIARDDDRRADQMKALDMLAKMGGAYLPERLEVSGPGGGDQVIRLEVSIEQAKREAAMLPEESE